MVTSEPRSGAVHAVLPDPHLGLTLLAPDNVAAILDGRQGPDVTLALLMEPVPAEWTEQFQSLVAA